MHLDVDNVERGDCFNLLFIFIVDLCVYILTVLFNDQHFFLGGITE